MAELKGIYKSDFDEVKKYIEKTSAKCPEREEIFESLSAIYFEAQENQTEISEIHEGTAKDYAKEIGLKAKFEEFAGFTHEWRFWDKTIQRAMDYFGLKAPKAPVPVVAKEEKKDK